MGSDQQFGSAGGSGPGDGGHGEPLDVLFARYASEVRQVVDGRVPRSDVDDVVQEVLLQACRSIATFEYRGRGSFEAWLRRIAAHRVIDRQRQTAVRERALGRQVAPRTEQVHRDTPSRVAIAREWLRQRQAVLAGLSERERAVVQLRDDERLSFAVIARRLGLTDAAAARRIYGELRRRFREAFPGGG